jgi:transposase
MDAELWANIRRLHLVDKLSRSAVARHLNVHRNTVRDALASPGGPPKTIPRRAPMPSKLDPFKAHILERLSLHPTLPGTTLFEDLKARGYTGRLAILWEHLKTVRPGAPQAFLRLETEPGEFAQVDWANCGTIQIGNAKRLLSCFVMVLSYSRMIYLEFTLSQCLEDFLQAHVNAFDFFGGVPDKINYDNLKTVVLSRVGKDIRFHPRFHAFAGFYVFEPIPCNVRAAWEKGKVESGIKYIRSSFLAGRDIHSFAQLQKDAVLWRDAVANVRVHGATRERPIDRFDLEKTKIHPVNSPEFDTAVHRHVTATRQALVMFETNRYSVPFVLAGKDLTLAATPHQVEIFDPAAKSVATHARCYERYRVLENPAHHEGLLADRKRAGATKRVEAFLALAPECADYLSGLVQAELHVPSHLDKIADLIRRYGKAEVMSAVLRALGFKAFGAHYIERIVHQTRAARDLKEPVPIELSKKPEWSRLAVEQTDLSLYDDLFEGEPHG